LLDEWQRVQGFRGSPVKFAPLLFSEKFNWAGKVQGLKELKEIHVTSCGFRVQGASIDD